MEWERRNVHESSNLLEAMFIIYHINRPPNSESFFRCAQTACHMWANASKWPFLPVALMLKFFPELTTCWGETEIELLLFFVKYISICWWFFLISHFKTIGSNGLPSASSLAKHCIPGKWNQRLLMSELGGFYELCRWKQISCILLLDFLPRHIYQDSLEVWEVDIQWQTDLFYCH